MGDQTDGATLTRQVRNFADTLDARGRGWLLYDLVRAIYDSEKFTGLGGAGLDGRDSTARASFARVSDAALRARSEATARPQPQ